MADQNGGEQVRAEEFDGLYNRTAARLVVHVALLTGDVGEAQDAVQEAFIRAWDHRERIDANTGAEAWVRTTAMRIAVSRWRRLRRMAVGARTPEVSTPGPGPDRVALIDAMRRLPEAQRTALALHYFCDLTLEQIAVDTRVPIGTVKARLSRGRAALADMLREPNEEDVHA